jgi:hypothetical protein
MFNSRVIILEGESAMKLLISLRTAVVCIVLMLLSATLLSHAQVQVQGGIFVDGTSLVVKAKPNQDVMGNLSAGNVTIRWDSTFGVNLLGSVTTSFGFFKDEGEKANSIFHYQVFAAVPIPTIPINWTANQEYELFRVSVNQGGSGAGLFELGSNGFAQDWYIELSGHDRTNSSNPFYEPTASAPLPIQLVSFAASVVRDNDVEVTWKTISETNNYGFEIYRKRGETGEWKKLAFLEGHGTTLAAQSYTYVDRSLGFGKYFYQVKQVDLDGKSKAFPEVDVTVGVVPGKLVLAQNYPNPFNPSTSIEFNLSMSGYATLNVYNLLGQEIAMLFRGEVTSGIYSVEWSPKNLASGVYVYRLEVESGPQHFVATRRLVLLK